MDEFKKSFRRPKKRSTNFLNFFFVNPPPRENPRTAPAFQTKNASVTVEISSQLQPNPIQHFSYFLSLVRPIFSDQTDFLTLLGGIYYDFPSSTVIKGLVVYILLSFNINVFSFIILPLPAGGHLLKFLRFSVVANAKFHNKTRKYIGLVPCKLLEKQIKSGYGKSC